MIWWFVLGGITWAVSVGIKVIFSGLLDLHVLQAKRDVSKKLHALLHGLLSAVTELGAAAFVFIRILPEGNPFYVIVFGIGAGLSEATVLLIIALFSKEKNNEKSIPWYQKWTFVIERFGALLGHVGSRGLVWLSAHGFMYPFFIALVLFASVDSVATYGVFKKWDWLEPKRWKRFYGFVTLMGIMEIILFLGLCCLYG